ALATDPEVPTLVDQVQKIATDSAVAVKSLNFGGEKKDKKAKEGTPTELAVGISIEGVYDNVLVYLRAVEQAARVLKINALRFTTVTGEGKSETGNITANVGLSSYYLPETAKASLESPVPADFQSKKYQDLLTRLRTLQVYRAIIDTSGVGKSDPFSR
ncbi:MAG: type 4a pilus biogenesis protein PilO, partial [bacterium]|nr:type 4a pilus biogenesis protein PilO [bacterium]